MSKPRCQFTIKALLIAVAVLAGFLWFLRPHHNDGAPIIDVFNSALKVQRDGSIEVHNGSVRIKRGGQTTEIRANRMVLRKDSTVEVYGPATLLQVSNHDR
jgi:hypothetical protein